MDAGLMYISFRGAKEELSAGKKQNKYLKQKDKGGSSGSSSAGSQGEAGGASKGGDGSGSTGSGGGGNDEVTQPNANPFKDDEVTQPNANPFKDDEITERFTWDDVTERTEIQPVQDKLDKVGKKDDEVTVRTVVPAEGHTNPKNSKEKNLHTEHETTVRTHMHYDQHAAPHQPGLKEKLLAKDSKIWCDPPGRPVFSDDEILLMRKLPGRDGGDAYNQMRDLIFSARNKRGVLHVDIVRTHQPENALGAAKAAQVAADPNSGLVVRQVEGKNVLYSEELNAKDLYPMMFDHFEDVARRTGKPIKGIDGHFAHENLQEMTKALEDPAIRSQLVIEEFGNGSMELRPEALEYSKTWKFWKDYVAKYGYTLAPTRSVTFVPEQGVFWSFDLKK
jgi:hypothetical protein